MTKCLLCGDEAVSDSKMSALNGMGGVLYACNTCGSFLMTNVSAFRPDGQQNQTPDILAALRDGLAKAQNEITDTNAEVIYINISILHEGHEDDIRNHVENNSIFPDDVIAKGFTVREVRKCNHCGTRHYYD